MPCQGHIQRPNLHTMISAAKEENLQRVHKKKKKKHPH